jgi:mono/diheme cytochrome c family protein
LFVNRISPQDSASALIDFSKRVRSIKSSAFTGKEHAMGRRTHGRGVSIAVWAGVLVVGTVAGCAMKGSQDRQASQAPSVERGRYIVQIGGCNDCHTPGFMQKGDAIPESQWLTGVPVGWRGPWGTSYSSNLRLFVRDFDEQTFVDVLRKRNTRPPMPWPALHAMTDQDLKSVYRYLVALGPAGEKMPEAVPPGQEPKTPYLAMEPVMPSAGAN